MRAHEANVETDGPPAIAAVNGVPLATPGEALAPEVLRQRAVTELLLQCAIAAGLAPPGVSGEVAVDAIERLLEREVHTPEPTEAECRRYYDGHRARFRSGDLVEASHILFAVTPSAPLPAIRNQAEATLKQLAAEPGRFAELAARFSNCPSGAQGGSLGQLGRGDTVPEFEAALFEGRATGVLARLVNTRYGFHVVRVHRRIEGREVPFELARPRIAEYLAERVRRKAFQQYVRVLAARADIQGIDLAAASSLLLQ